MEYWLKHKSGEYRWIGDHGTPFHDLDGSFLGYIGSGYDISEQLEAKEKLKRLNSTKNQFFRILVHDLRNPIATFVSMSELLKEGYQDFTTEETTEIAEHMHKDSKNTMALLDHVLEWSRSQSDQISFNPMPVKVGDLFEDAVSHVDLCAKAKGVGIRTEVLRGDGDVALTFITVGTERRYQQQERIRAGPCYLRRIH